MYKGKYEQNQTPAAPKAARVPAPQENTEPTASRPAPQRNPQRTPQRSPQHSPQRSPNPQHNLQHDPQRKPNPQRKRRKGVTTGTYAFYGVYLFLILAVFIGVAIGMGALKDWLVNFQAAQPETKSQQVFQQLFSDPDWGEICTLANPDADPDVVEAYEKYMTELVGDDELTYIKGASISGDKKYIVCHGTTGIAEFTLTADNMDAEVPDWRFGTVNTLFTPNLSYSIVALPGYTVKVNGEALGEDDIVRTISTKAEEYLPDGVHGYRRVEYRVSGLEKAPEVVILDESGAQVEASFDDATNTYAQVTSEQPTITADSSEYQAVLGAAKAWTEYMIKGGTAGLKKYYNTNTQAYKDIVGGLIFRQSYSSYSFGQEEITDYYRYSDTLFSAKIHLITTVVRKADGYNKEFEVDVTYIFEKTNGKWMVYDQVNVEVQEQITEVRLTYKDADGNEFYSDLVSTDAKTLTIPAIEVPEGKTFAGWYVKSTDILGNTALTEQFHPDENGNVTVVQTLEPMVLVPQFEDAQEEG